MGRHHVQSLKSNGRHAKPMSANTAAVMYFAGIAICGGVAFFILTNMVSIPGLSPIQIAQPPRISATPATPTTSPVAPPPAPVVLPGPAASPTTTPGGTSGIPPAEIAPQGAPQGATESPLPIPQPTTSPQDQETSQANTEPAPPAPEPPSQPAPQPEPSPPAIDLPLLPPVEVPKLLPDLVPNLVPQLFSKCSSIGLLSQAVAGCNAIMSAVPGITILGGRAKRPNNPSSCHPKGLGLDLMVYRDKALGDRIAAYARQNKTRLGINLILWQTRDHYDHVHLSFAPCKG